MSQEIFKVKTIDKHIIKVKGELVEENKSKAPAWFSEWVENDFKELKEDMQDFKKEVGERFDNLVTKNNLKE